MRIEHYATLPDDARVIRTEVFVDEQGFTEEFDTDDSRAIHIVGYLGDEPIATSRILKNSDGSYFIGRIAVTKAYRKNGYGAKIVSAAEKIIFSNGGRTVFIHSQEQAVPFYSRIGYVLTGERDYEEGCPHCMMIKHL